MAPLEVYWLVYLCVIEVMTIALIDSSLTRRFDNRRMVLYWSLIAIVPVVIALALQYVPPFFSEFWPNRYVPRAGVPLLFLPVFPAIGSLLLYDDKRTSKISATMYSYIRIATMCGLFSISISVVASMLMPSIVGEGRGVLLPLTFIMGLVLIMNTRKGYLGDVGGFYSADTAFARRFARISLFMGISVHMCLYLCLFEYGNNNIAVTILTMMMSILFLAMLRMMVIGMEETSANARFTTELDTASGLQQSVLCSDVPPWMPEIEVEATMHPARSVGGDFYDVFPIDDNRLAFIVADVSDKGIPAALFMMRCHGIVREKLITSGDMDEAMLGISEALSEQNPSCMFVTAFIGVFDLDMKTLEYVNAGHVGPIASIDGELRILDSNRGPLLGVKKLQYDVGKLDLSDRDSITVFTDGVTEASVNGGFYGMGNMEEVIAGDRHPKEIIEGILSDMKSTVTSIDDDLTIMSIMYRSSSRRSFEANLDGVDSAMDWISGLIGMSELGLRIQLVAEEVCMNIASHSDATAFTMMYRETEGIEIMFIDDGVPFDMTSVPDLPRGVPPQRDGPGGNGLRLVRKMSDRIAYKRHSGRNILTVYIQNRD